MRDTASWSAVSRRTLIAAAALAPLPLHAGPSGDDAERSFAATLTGLEGEIDFSGAVLVRRSGVTRLRCAYGIADRAYSIRNRPETRFNLASLGKMFTAVAVMRQVESGRLRLSDTISAHLPGYPRKDVATRVTIEHLLTHGSGLGSAPEKFAARPNGSLATLADHLGVFGDEPLRHEPGSAFLYSNPGYVILGLILEAVTGEDFYAHIDRVVLQPAGMTASGYPRLDAANPETATGHTRALETPGLWNNNLFVSAVRGGPHGGGYSTVDDLGRFGEALMSGRLVSAATFAEMSKPRFRYHRGHYGYGVSSEVVAGRTILGHSGGHPGVGTELMLVPETGDVVVILSNGEIDGFFAAHAAAKRLVAGEDASTRNHDYSVAIARVLAVNGLNAGLARHAVRDPALNAREGLLDAIALRHLHRGDKGAARSILEFNTRAFPESSWAEWSLAEALRVSGDRAAAIAAYRAYQRAEPSDPDSAKRIAALERQR
jgi:CubicO group peptidase (beta-lactamase class C family)